MGFEKAKRDLKAIYGHSQSEYSDNERRNTLYIMFGGSQDITSHRIIKNLRREVAAAVPTPRVDPHHKWMETSISFDASDCPKSMAGPTSSYCLPPRPSSTSRCTMSLLMVVHC
jgi:hypothetical protein